MLQGASDEKDLGVIVQDDLFPRKYISKVVGGTYRLIVQRKNACCYLYNCFRSGRVVVDVNGKARQGVGVHCVVE